MKVTELPASERQIVVRFDNLFEEIIFRNIFASLWMNPSLLRKLMSRSFTESDLEKAFDLVKNMRDSFEA
jgi:hypothetical protein